MPNYREANLQKWRIKNLYDNKLPNRSFPVPNCKYVAIAKAYLGRSKFSVATKKKIAACINRKAKKLGCNVTKKAKATFEDLSPELQKLAEDKIFKATIELVEQSLKNEGMDLDFSDCPEEDCIQQ